jgi:hypothetical protein
MSTPGRSTRNVPIKTFDGRDPIVDDAASVTAHRLAPFPKCAMMIFCRRSQEQFSKLAAHKFAGKAMEAIPPDSGPVSCDRVGLPVRLRLVKSRRNRRPEDVRRG